MIKRIYTSNRAVITGMLANIALLSVSTGLESTCFWSRVARIKIATGELDSFTVGERVLRYPTAIIMILCFAALRFGLPIFITARTVLIGPLRQSITLFIIMLLTTILLTEGWLKRPLLSIAEIMVIVLASVVSYALGHHYFRKRPTSGCSKEGRS